MRQQGEGEQPESGTAAGIEPSTVWRVTLAWPVTTEDGRQDRVDGLQQLLSARAVVGLMGPGRPTREGMVVDLVLPVLEASILLATRDGALQTGPVGDDFAWELHRYTGAVVVNGDLATGDFAVLASDGSLSDQELARLLDEPLDSALLVGTVGTGTVEEVADRLELNGWISDGERPVLAARQLAADPTSLVLPGTSGLSIGLRERPGRVDLMLWGAQDRAEAEQRPTRRRRAAHRTPVISTHFGARCRAVVLPEFMHPAGSDVQRLLERLDEDFAPLPGDAINALGTLLTPAQCDALTRAVNDAPTRGLDPEGGVLAPFEDGLMPGEELPQEPQRSEHADLEAVLSALGEDPGLVGLFDGAAPTGRGARPLGEAFDGEPQSRPIDASAPGRRQAAPTSDGRYAPVAPPANAELPTLAEAGDPEAAARLAGDRIGDSPRSGGFSSLVQRHTSPVPIVDFDDVVRPPSSTARGAHAGTATQVARSTVPRPTPAAGTAASSAGDDSAALRGRRWPLALLVVGIVVLVLAGVLALLAPRLGAASGTGYIVAIAGGVVGLGLLIVGLASRQR